MPRENLNQRAQRLNATIWADDALGLRDLLVDDRFVLAHALEAAVLRIGKVVRGLHKPPAQPSMMNDE